MEFNEIDLKRRILNISKKDLLKRSGLSPATYNRWKKGANITLSTLNKIQNTLAEIEKSKGS